MFTNKVTTPPLQTGSGLTKRAGTAPDHYSPEQRLLPRLDGVRQIGPDTWMAKSPCRDDRTASVSIKRVDDRLLIHDFGGNSPDEIMQAVGLSLSDLFERPLGHNVTPMTKYQRKRHGVAREALAALVHEVALVWVLAEQMHAGFALDPAERIRLKTAMRRLQNAKEVAG